MAKQLHADTRNSIEDICTTLGISRATLYRYLAMNTNGMQKEGLAR